ncbi:hypothetical protein BASA60_008161 [Batrachochytrium salamandrivorans]|nr:hypothetical protein BASA60_008161 [Batrachochytrium salamandrivorans]KAH9272513.1 hypothetical protein BASA83_005322 [Batrachochytrium salamandrivorans]
MKLISFVAISFLAITVSAWPPRSPRQFSQDEIQAEIDRLREAYEEEERIFAPIENDAKIKRQTAIALIHKGDSIVAQLKEAGLNGYTKPGLEKKYDVAKARFGVLNSEYEDQLSSYASARQKYTDAKAELELLMENKERIVDYNGKYGAQTGSSLGSFYSIGFLEEQRDEILKDLAISLAELKKIESLLKELKGIKTDKSGPRSGLVVQSNELKDKIQICESQCKIVKKILRDYERSQPIGARFMKFINSHLPNGPIE